MRFADHDITAAFVRSVLDYDAATGLMFWRFGHYAGRSAGFVEDGYLRLALSVQGKKRIFRVNRLAWLHHYGRHATGLVDHRDLDKSNNAIDNLRDATAAQNVANSGLRSTNSSGHKGVSWHTRDKRWVAKIRHGGGLEHLGNYTKFEDACAAYVAKAREVHGQFARL